MCLAQVSSASVVAWVAAVHVHGSVAACSLLGVSFFVACRKIPSAVQVPAHGVQDPAHDSLCSRLVGGTRLCSCVSCSHFPRTTLCSMYIFHGFDSSECFVFVV